MSLADYTALEAATEDAVQDDVSVDETQEDR